MSWFHMHCYNEEYYKLFPMCLLRIMNKSCFSSSNNKIIFHEITQKDANLNLGRRFNIFFVALA